MMKHISATVLLQRPNGSLLMQLRDDGGGAPIPLPNMWNFPGDTAEPNEKPIDAAIRETEEEFEIRLKPTDCKEISCNTHDHAESDHIFFCRVPADTIPILHQGSACAWMTLGEIVELDLGFDSANDCYVYAVTKIIDQVAECAERSANLATAWYCLCVFL